MMDKYEEPGTPLSDLPERLPRRERFLIAKRFWPVARMLREEPYPEQNFTWYWHPFTEEMSAELLMNRLVPDPEEDY